MKKLNPHIVKHRSEFNAPIADSSMRNLDIKGGLEYQADISEGIFTEIKHRQSRDNNLNGIPHTLKIMLPEKRGHGGAVWRRISIQRKNDCTSCRRSGSLNNAHSRGAEKMLFRIRGRADISADSLPPPPAGVRVQIDDGSSGRGTFDNRQNLCRNDKINDCCCISDT